MRVLIHAIVSALSPSLLQMWRARRAYDRLSNATRYLIAGSIKPQRSRFKCAKCMLYLIKSLKQLMTLMLNFDSSTSLMFV